MCLIILLLPLFSISQSEAVSTILISCNVTDLIWLQYHGHLAKFGYGKYLIVQILVSFGSILGLFGLTMSILT